MNRNPYKPFMALVVAGLILSGMVSGVFSAKAHAAGAVYDDAELAPVKSGTTLNISQAAVADGATGSAGAGDLTPTNSNAASETYRSDTGDVPETASIPLTTESMDTNADGSAEVGALYDYGSASTGLFVFEASGTDFTTRKAWNSGAGNWEWARTKTASGDFNGDGKTDLAMLYDYGSASTGLFVFEASGTGFTTRQAWTSGAGNWEWYRTKMASGDFNGDGKTDLAMLYDYDNASTGLFVFEAAGTGFNVRKAWNSGAGNWEWARTKMASGDFNADGNADLAMLYDYSGASTGLFVFEAAGTTFNPRKAWNSGAGNWEWASTKMASGDFNADGNADLAMLYDYGSASTGIFVFEAAGTGFNVRKAWNSGAGNWEYARTKITSGDFNADGKTDLAMLYDYSNASTGLFVFETAGTTFNARKAWNSGAGNWQWSSSKVVDASNFLPRSFNMGIQWVDINLSSQTLTVIGVVIYEYEERRYAQTSQAVFSSLVSSGKPGYETPTGQYFVYSKQIAADMQSGPGAAEPYYAPAVPYVLWFTGSYSIHGANWHNNFGRAVSHGCVNLPMGAAAWVFQSVGVGMRVSVHY
jgi:hypothetical protein